MKLVKLKVERFQCIEAAELEFGPGLNVLYGPNDIGKSSLAWAIRAVLLLQHGSSHQERFVSWYAGGEPPRVELTFVNTDQRYWRVTKIFGGTAGRSKLQISNDGRTFTDEASGRQVDDKVRKMLGWGINTPGGKSGPRGVPDAFLIQVLLAEQDNVRKILFESSLSKDPDGSGRARLTAALEAIAQDPDFKKILDKAQAQTDKAFTATGRKKSTASSPFIELNSRIKDLEREQSELETKVRETALAEDRIRELIEQRDDLGRKLKDNREMFATMQVHLKSQRERDQLCKQIAALEVEICGAAQLQQNIEIVQNDLAAHVQQAEALNAQAREAASLASQLEAARDQARAQLDALTHGDTESDERRAALEEAQHAAQEALSAAQRAAETADASLKQARDISLAFGEALAASSLAAKAAVDVDASGAAAAAEATRARQVAADAEQGLRDATSDDRSRTRELRRVELQNRRLTLQSERAKCAATLQRFAETQEANESAATAATSHQSLVTETENTKHTSAKDEAELARLDAKKSFLVAQERYGHLQQRQAALANALRVKAGAQLHRERAGQLRGEEAALRANIIQAVPSSDSIAALRALREKLRIADAQIAVGLSVTVRPRHPIAIRIATDAAAETASSLGQPLSLTAQRQITLAIDNLVDLEILAGEATARTDAASLRHRWESEGVTVLHEYGLETVEDLEKLRVDTDGSIRAADDLRREAEAAEQQAEQLTAGAGAIAELESSVAELGREIGAFDQITLKTALAQFGDAWPAAIKKSLEDLEQDRQRTVAAVDAARLKLAGLEAQLQVQANSAETTRLKANQLQSALPNANVDETKASVDKLDRELAEIEQEVVTATSGASDEESTARSALVAAKEGVEQAEKEAQRRQMIASTAREAAIQAATRLDGVRNRARELDAEARWSGALADGSALPIDQWQLESSNAEQRRQAVKTAYDEAAKRLEDAINQRGAAIKSARESFEKADASARSARAKADELAGTSQTAKDKCHRLTLELGEMRVQAAGANLATARDSINKLQETLRALGPLGETVELAVVERQQWTVENLDGQLHEAEQELAKARGALEQVGGAIVRERQRDVLQAIEQAQEREHEITVEYDAWRLLVETLRATESAEGAHLGRVLATPVSERFNELTDGRYGRLELGAHLESTGIHADGDVREIGALSAGTQDQLATLLRLCIAEQLGSSIVLDDHLSQSDPERIGWFNSVLRRAAKQIQIVLITCRPSEVLSTGEFPIGNDPAKTTAAGLLHAVDLTRVIRRFG